MGLYMKLKHNLTDLTNGFNYCSNSDYLVFRSDGTTISTDFNPTEAAAIYNVIKKLPFPMNTAPRFAQEITELLGDQNPELLNTEEKKVIQTALKNIAPDLYVIPFPKSLYQFYFFAAAENILLSENAKTFVKYYHNLEKQICDDITSKRKSLKGNPLHLNVYGLYNTDIRRAIFCKIDAYKPDAPLFQVWLQLNTSLIHEFMAIDRLTPTKDTLDYFADTWLKTFLKLNISKKHFAYEKNNIKFLHQLLKYEIKIMLDPKRAGTHVMYRGSMLGPESDRALLLAEPTHALSFSDTLCEGMLLCETSTDASNAVFFMQLKRGASTLGHSAFTEYKKNHSSEDLHVGFAVFLDKKEYRNRYDHPLQQLFVIQPLTTLQKALYYGDDFHARTIGDIHSSDYNELVADKALTIVRNGSSTHLIADYLDKNSEILDHLRDMADLETLQPKLNTMVYTDTMTEDTNVRKAPQLLVSYGLYERDLRTNVFCPIVSGIFDASNYNIDVSSSNKSVYTNLSFSKYIKKHSPENDFNNATNGNNNFEKRSNITLML